MPPIGERIREERARQGWTVRRLAAEIGVSASLISQIETGKVQPSVNTLYALATELGLSIDSLMFPDGAGRPVLPSVQRATDRTVIPLGSGAHWERLTAAAEPGRDFLYLVYEPGGESTPPDIPHRHTGREWGYIVSGTLHVELGDESYSLAPGDSITYDSRTPHRLHNDGPDEVRAIWFVLGRTDDTEQDHGALR